eukprot:1054391-Pyramimonas_sp.AAC.1
MTRDPPPQVRGERVGGGVSPSPKGKKRVGRRSALNHPRSNGPLDYVAFSAELHVEPVLHCSGHCWNPVG